MISLYTKLFDDNISSNLDVYMRIINVDVLNLQQVNTYKG